MRYHERTINTTTPLLMRPQDGNTVHLKAKSSKDSNLGLSFVFISDFM